MAQNSTGCRKGDFEVISDICYCTCTMSDCVNGFSKHQLDLFLPNHLPPSQCPIVVFVHGGSWIRGDRRGFRHFFSFYDTNLLVAVLLYYYGVYWNVGRSFAESGIACAVVSYRLSCLEFPWVLLELFSSMLMSLTAVLVPLSLLALLSCGMSVLFGSNLPLSISESWYSQKLLLSTVFIFISLSSVWLVVCQVGELYSINCTKKLLPFIISLSVSGLCITVLNVEWETCLLCLTSCFAMCLLHTFLEFKTRPTITHPDHVMDVAHSVRWVKTYGASSGRFNACELFLCGHSAGGHLVSLLALEEDFLRRAGLSAKDIKGVISISGVYNLEYLTGGLTEHLILRPAFGGNANTWRKASPFYCISVKEYSSNGQEINPCNNVSFLVINAEKDFHLVKDAELFVKKLKDVNFECSHVVIKGENHFSIAVAFGKSRPPDGGLAIDELCAKFVREISQ